MKKTIIALWAFSSISAFAGINCNSSELKINILELSYLFKAEKSAGHISLSEESYLQAGLKELEIMQGIACGWIRVIKAEQKTACQTRAESLLLWSEQLAEGRINLVDYQSLIEGQKELEEIESCRH